MEYKVSLDNTSKAVTTFVVIICATLAYLILSTSFRQPGIWSPILGSFFGIVFPCAVLFGPYYFKPLKYIVSENKIIVKRLFKDVIIEVGQIKKISLVQRETMKNTLRAMGNGGVFGYYGKFRNPVFGDMRWYATRTDNFVVIETEDSEKIVLTPDDTELVKRVKGMLKTDNGS